MKRDSRRIRRMYMHTIDGMPATWSAFNEQIVFADVLPQWEDRPLPATLRASVRQIERDQEATRKNRARWKFKGDAGKYGYIIVRVRV